MKYAKTLKYLSVKNTGKKDLGLKILSTKDYPSLNSTPLLYCYTDS